MKFSWKVIPTERGQSLMSGTGNNSGSSFSQPSRKGYFSVDATKGMLVTAFSEVNSRANGVGRVSTREGIIEIVIVSHDVFHVF